jgi:hypothetical protein
VELRLLPQRFTLLTENGIKTPRSPCNYRLTKRTRNQVRGAQPCFEIREFDVFSFISRLLRCRADRSVDNDRRG